MTNLSVAAHLGSGGGGGTESNNKVPTPTKKLIRTSIAENNPGRQFWVRNSLQTNPEEPALSLPNADG